MSFVILVKKQIFQKKENSNNSISAALKNLTIHISLLLIFLIKKRMRGILHTLSLQIIFLFLVSLFSISYGQQVEIKQDLNILILGNSVLHHIPAEEIGWKGDWGMAATDPENDFAHILQDKLNKSQHYKNVNYYTQNIAFWENDFNFNLDIFETIKDRKFDVLVIRLGENVSDLKNYKTALKKLIDKYGNPNAQVLISGTVWNKLEVEMVHKDLATGNNITFVSFADLRLDRKNFSRKLYSNSAVASHPSDKGMRVIAELLYDAILNLCKKTEVTQ